MNCTQAPPARDTPSDYQTRIRLAKAILNERPVCELTCELAVMALRGATLAQILTYAAAAVA